MYYTNANIARYSRVLQPKPTPEVEHLSIENNQKCGKAAASSPRLSTLSFLLSPVLVINESHNNCRFLVISMQTFSPRKITHGDLNWREKAHSRHCLVSETHRN